VVEARTAVQVEQSLPIVIVGMLRADGKMLERYARRSATSAARSFSIVDNLCFTRRIRRRRVYSGNGL
jgi:hypothetical protein